MKPDLLTASLFNAYWRSLLIPVAAVVYFYRQHLLTSGDDEKKLIYFALACLSLAVGVVFFELTRCVRYLHARNEELAKQAGIDNERMWRLEETVRALQNENNKPAN